MLVEQHYVTLRVAFLKYREREPIEVTREELAGLLHVTERNVHFLLKKMEQQGWIQWEAGRGRGNRSSLTFLADADEMALKLAQDMVRRGMLKEAYEQVQVPSVSKETRSRFQKWLSQQFGHTQEVQANGKIDTLRIPSPIKAYTLDPAHAITELDVFLCNQIFDSLITYYPDTRMIEPRVAHYWETDEEKRNWTFYLRKGVLFHNGKTLTSHDVVYTFRRLLDPLVRSPFRQFYEFVRDVQMLDERVVRFVLHEPQEHFLQLIGSQHALIVPDQFSQIPAERFAVHPVGTGAFRVVEHTESKIVLEAFSSYFQTRAHLDRVEVWFLPQLLEERNVDLTNFHLMLWKSRQHTPSEWQEQKAHYTSCKLLSFNRRKEGPLRNLPFCEVLYRAIQVEELIGHLQGDMDVMPLHSLIHDEGISAYARGTDLPEAVPLPRTRTEETDWEKVIRESGYRGEPLVLGHSGNWLKEVAWIKEKLEKVGIHLELRKWEVNQFQDTAFLDQVDLVLVGLGVSDQDWEEDLLLFLQMEDWFFRRHFHEEVRDVVDRELQQLSREDRADRLLRIARLENYLLEQYAFRYLYKVPHKSVYHPALKGISLHQGLRHVWFHTEGSPSVFMPRQN